MLWSIVSNSAIRSSNTNNR